MRIERSSEASHSSLGRREARRVEEASDARQPRSDAPSLPALRPEDAPRAREKGAYAPLLAQLIATSLDMPQTRARRRATPERALSAYAAAPQPARAAPRFARDV